MINFLVDPLRKAYCNRLQMFTPLGGSIQELTIILLSMRGLLSFTTLASTLAMVSSAAIGARAPSCTGPVKSSPTTYWLTEQDHTGKPLGICPQRGRKLQLSRVAYCSGLRCEK
jgi:hypothetical protein